MKAVRTIEKAEREIAEGSLWRAKEILQGAIPNASYDRALFEKLGNVLLKMGDLPAAGQYLFLSGERREEYEDAIRIFLWKYRKNPRALYAAFPRPAKLLTRADYPVMLQHELKDLGFPELLKASPVVDAHEDSWIPPILGWAIFGSVLVLMLLGVIKVIEIWHWLKTRSH